MLKKSNQLSSSAMLLALATGGTAFASAGYVLNGSIPAPTLAGWFILFILGHGFASFFSPEESDAWPWLAARWCGYGCLLAFCLATLHFDISMSVRLLGLLVWKWADIGITYKVVNSD